jgi:hypothetical protein
MDGEFPVEDATTKFLFCRIWNESPQTGDRTPPSYFVSLVTRRAVRRIVFFSHSHSELKNGPCGTASNELLPADPSSLK